MDKSGQWQSLTTRRKAPVVALATWFWKSLVSMFFEEPAEIKSLLIA